MIKRGALLGVLLAVSGCSDLCSNAVVSRGVSPDGTRAALLFARSCGATTRMSKSALDKRFAEAAREFLGRQPEGGHVQTVSFAWSMRLDTDRIDVVRAYVLACSKFVPGQGPCRQNLAVAMRYDMMTDEVSELSLLRDIRDARGRLTLPELPGR